MSAPPRDFSGQEIVSVLGSFGYRKDRQRGSHAILKYTNPDTGEVRTVTVPLHDRVKIGTLQSVAEQCGADDFDAWCRWIDEHRRLVFHFLSVGPILSPRIIILDHVDFVEDRDEVVVHLAEPIEVDRGGRPLRAEIVASAGVLDE